MDSTKLGALAADAMTHLENHYGEAIIGDALLIVEVISEDGTHSDIAIEPSSARNHVTVWEIVPKLGPYEFLCVRRQRGGKRALYVSRVEGY